MNSIWTARGGTHVTYIVDQLVKDLVNRINRKYKDVGVQPCIPSFHFPKALFLLLFFFSLEAVRQVEDMVKNQLSLYINCLIENPTFDSQTKETLTLKPSNYGSRCILSDEFLR